MRGITLIAGLGVMTIWHVPMFAQDAPPQKAAADAPKVYDSPQAVFNACREAVVSGDSRTQYSCFTTEGLEQIVSEVYFVHGENPKFQAMFEPVLKKFDAEVDTIHVEYNKRHKAKYGVDPQDFRLFSKECG